MISCDFGPLFPPTRELALAVSLDGPEQLNASNVRSGIDILTLFYPCDVIFGPLKTSTTALEILASFNWI